MKAILKTIYFNFLVLNAGILVCQEKKIDPTPNVHKTDLYTGEEEIITDYLALRMALLSTGKPDQARDLLAETLFSAVPKMPTKKDKK